MCCMWSVKTGVRFILVQSWSSEVPTNHLHSVFTEIRLLACLRLYPNILLCPLHANIYYTHVSVYSNTANFPLVLSVNGTHVNIGSVDFAPSELN